MLLDANNGLQKDELLKNLTKRNTEFKRLRKLDSLRYGHCRIWGERSVDDLIRKSTISILSTENKQWKDLLQELKVKTSKEALIVFLSLLRLYQNPDNKVVSLEEAEFLLKELNLKANIEIIRIPEHIIYALINSCDQGNPDDPLAEWREPVRELVVNYVDATVIRVLGTLAKWAKAPYKISFHSMGDVSFRCIEPFNERFPADSLSRDCYNKFIMDEVSKWDPKGSFWRFLEKKVQGRECCLAENSGNDGADETKEGFFLGVGPHDRGKFTNGTILWNVLKDRKILRFRSEVEFVCAGCGGKFWYYYPEEDLPEKNGKPVLCDQNELKNSRNLGGGWVWRHYPDCRYSSTNGFPEKFFLVQYDNRLYFHDMRDSEQQLKKIKCVKCDVCSAEYQKIFQQENKCVSTISETRRCKWCNAELGEGHGDLVSAPICDYIPAWDDVFEDDDFLTIENKCLASSFIREIGADNFKDFLEKMSRVDGSNDPFNQFEETASGFWNQNGFWGNDLDFKKLVKSVLLAMEFDFWRVQTSPEEQSSPKEKLEVLFNSFWEGDHPLKTKWGGSLRGRTFDFVKKHFKQNGENA